MVATLRRGDYVQLKPQVENMVVESVEQTMEGELVTVSWQTRDQRTFRAVIDADALDRAPGSKAERVQSNQLRMR